VSIKKPTSEETCGECPEPMRFNKEVIAAMAGVMRPPVRPCRVSARNASGKLGMR
jgi:hypothetical protein